MMLYLFCLLSLSMTVNESTLISQKVEFKDIDKAPDISSWIRPLRIVSVLEMCLLSCSKITECKYVLYDSPKCYLYNTSDGSSVLMSGQQAVLVVLSKSFCGMSFLIYIKAWCARLCMHACVRACMHEWMRASMPHCIWTLFSRGMGYKENTLFIWQN